MKKESVSRASRLFSVLRLLGGVVLAHHSALQMLTESLGTPTRGEVFYGTLGSLFPVAALAAVFMVVRSFRSLRGYSYAVLMMAGLLAWGSL